MVLHSRPISKAANAAMAAAGTKDGVRQIHHGTAHPAVGTLPRTALFFLQARLNRKAITRRADVIQVSDPRLTSKGERARRW